MGTRDQKGDSLLSITVVFVGAGPAAASILESIRISKSKCILVLVVPLNNYPLIALEAFEPLIVSKFKAFEP